MRQIAECETVVSCKYHFTHEIPVSSRGVRKQKISKTKWNYLINSTTILTGSYIQNRTDKVQYRQVSLNMRKELQRG